MFTPSIVRVPKPVVDAFDSARQNGTYPTALALEDDMIRNETLADVSVVAPLDELGATRGERFALALTTVLPIEWRL